MTDNIRKLSASSPTPAPTGIALPTLTDDSVSETLTTLLERKGKFQCIVILLLSLNSISIGINHTVTAFHIYVSDFFCKDNPTEQCGVYVNGTECPSGYIFNKQDDHSVAVEWSLVCNQRMLAPLANTIYFIGVTLGALICSALCDIWGRKKLVLICMYAQAVMGFGQYISRSFVMFCFFRLLQGFFIQGMQTCSYTLMLELCPSRYRTKAAIIWELNWTVGLGLLSIATYFIPEWRLLTLVLTLPAVFSLSYSWIFPESITWLFAKGYNKEVLEQVHKIANFNNSYDIAQRCNSFDFEAKNKEDNQSTIEQNREKTTKLSAIVRSSLLRKHLFSMIFIWFSVTLSYYGVLFFLPNLAGERHLNFFLGAVAEMIAYILAYFVLSRFGRRMPLAFYQYANGTLLLLIGLITTIPEETQIKVWALIIITLIAKGFAVSSFCTMFIYGSELFPTVCRGFGLGLCGFAARCGSLLAPQLLALDNPTEQCGVYVNGTECPSGYIFNKQDDHSVAVEWSLVCNQRMLAPLANTIYFIGVTLGALICSALCDIWGRKKLVLICMYAQAVMGFGQYISRSFVMFCFFRLLQGFFIQGMQTCSYTLMLELCPSRYRTKAAIIWELNWTVGLGLLSIATYFIPEWRLLTLVLTLPAVFSLSYSWIFPESITWLFAKGYNKEVLEQVHKIANFNNSYDIAQRCNSFDFEAKNKEDNQSTIEQNREKTTKLSAIVRSSVLRKHLFSMIFIWFSVTLSYYGVLFFLPNLAGERHLNFFLGAVAEMIAYILAYFVLSRFGRRMPLAFYQYANGTLLLLIGLITTIPEETQIKVWALIIITLIAKGFAVSSFCTMFIYGSELFPTVCRGFGLGLCGFAARCGSLLAPQLLALNYFVPEYVPLLIMAVFLLSAASITLILPETLLSNLPNTAEEAEEMWALKK